MKKIRIPLLLCLLLGACQREKVKVIQETYASGNPETVFYFASQADADKHPIVRVTDGEGTVNIPLSFEEERYYENGKLATKGGYSNGKENGRWEYFYETGILQARCYYRNGLSRDSVHCYYPSGKLKRLLVEIDTNTNFWHGIDYYENGNPSLAIDFFDDEHDNWRVNGAWQEWFENGKLKLQATVKDNWTVGKWQEWDSAGNRQVIDTARHIYFE